ncbi:MAG: hypothetical protein GF417_01215 [Candidatus Latescibacteria bacterium]|nr:hypothetical protein [bacterium]MBD3423047.1 hypothetical protein [Candidatus Latescibacterota bacterium]
MIDISDPGSLSEEGYYDTEGISYAIELKNDFAYLADGYEGLRIIDISVPSAPEEYGYYDTGDQALGIGISGGVCMLADESLGLYVFDIPVVTGDDSPEVTARTMLFQNVPNPFNPSTEIRFEIPRRMKVRLSIYSVTGEMIRVLLDEVVDGGRNRAVWDGTNNKGQRVSSGIYFYRLETPELFRARKMVLLK